MITASPAGFESRREFGMPPIRVGTSGWSYRDWVSPFYPPGTQPGDHLSFYAGRFDAVEVDSTFYAIPSARTVAGWAARTPDRFRFCVKVPRTLTHEKVLVRLRRRPGSIPGCPRTARTQAPFDPPAIRVSPPKTPHRSLRIL
jgi:uncharacterized protein YecE (DUF72 family)